MVVKPARLFPKVELHLNGTPLVARLLPAVNGRVSGAERDDDEMASLTTLASALPPASRDGFLQMVAGKLSAYPPEARGPGLVHRLATEAQRDFLRVAVGGGGKYR